MPTEFAEAIAKGVQNWMDTNGERVMAVIQKATTTSMEGLGRAVQKKADSFFDDNRDEIISVMAASIALIWQRNHPSIVETMNGVPSSSPGSMAPKPYACP